MNDLPEIATAVRACQLCPLGATRKNAVPGEGPKNAALMLIGEGPGFNEDQQGRPFVGASGKFLDELIASAGYRRADVFIANVVKCRPPENRDPTPDEIDACRPFLDRQIELINPAVIVTLGRFSMARWFPGAKISAIHGKAKKIEGRTIVPMFHPAAALHQPALRDAIIADFEALPALIAAIAPERKTPPPEPPEQLRLF